jgi:hypothetical protein
MILKNNSVIIGFLLFVSFLINPLLSFATKYTYVGNATIEGGGTYCQNATASSILVTAETSKCGNGSAATANWTITIYQDTDTDPNNGKTQVAQCTGNATTCSYTPSTSSCGTFYYYAIITWAPFTQTGCSTAAKSGELITAAVEVTVDCSSYCGNEWFFPSSINLSGSTATYCDGDAVPDISGLIDITSCGTGTDNYANWSIVIYQDSDGNFGNGGATAVATCVDPNNSCSYTPDNTTCGTFYYYAIVSWDSFAFDPSCSGIGGGSYTSSAVAITIDCDPSCSSTTTTIEPGIIVNEYSNGDSGTREFMEFLVIGDPCTTVDLRGWIFDDNNGLNDATCEGFTVDGSLASGIAGGHNRFKYISEWSAVPVGSLILVYNDGDKNIAISVADDLEDSNNDSVYVLPISASYYFEGNGSVPVNGGSCLYSGGSYGSPSWSYIGLRNDGDACQTRRPDGSYFHGFAYGSNLDGGPDNLYFSGSGADKNYYLNCGHHSFITDYSTGDGDFSDGASDETPGLSNNTSNDSLVNFYRGTYGCGFQPICVVILLSNNKINLSGKVIDDGNMIYWDLTDEIGVKSFLIQRSLDNINFENIGIVKTQQLNRYSFIDKYPKEQNYYRVVASLENGSQRSNTIVLNNSITTTFGANNLIPNPANNSFSFDFELKERGVEVQFAIYNILGEIVQQRTLNASQNVRIESSNLESGIYYLVFSSDSERLSMKMLIQH